ncbi:HlyIII-domain-containing protein [Marasmius fiardii PR-910]|nr:HlyIII-domain-containing protein [Marasmius fiardii PR-910]
MSSSYKQANGERSKVNRTVSLKDLPSWKRYNVHILTGYRRPQESWGGCIHSIYAYVHNETGNIHTHLWGGVLFVYFLITVHPLQLTSGTTTWMDSAVFSIFLASAVFCLLSSATYHTSIAHQSREVCSRCHALDYGGIIVLTLGSFCPLLYYGFFCEPKTLKLYTSIVLLLNAAGAFVVIDPEYAKPSHIALRTAIFLSLGLFAVIPIIHLLIIYGPSITLTGMGFKWFILSGFFYIGGALLYANRIPERFNPGRYDYLFHSHQIFHICVVTGAYLHYVFISTALDYSYTRSKCA